jgi:transcriptional regulator with XRE-family HTH domain
MSTDQLYLIFRRNVTRRMEELGINQVDLAEKLGVTKASVNHVLTGYRHPGLKTLDSFARVLRCEPADLLAKKIPQSA